MTSAIQKASAPDRILRWTDVQRRVGYSRSQINLLILNGQFPRPHTLGARANAWLESSIDEWTASRLAVSEQEAHGAALRGAVNAMCKSCIYDPCQKGAWVKQVHECTATSCPLYSFRPGPRGAHGTIASNNAVEVPPVGAFPNNMINVATLVEDQ